jgi:hypothetical protein
MTNLITECREFDASIYRDAAHANAGMTAKLQEAADTIEAQAKQIAELEKAGNEWYEAHNSKRIQIEALQAKLSVIEAQEPAFYLSEQGQLSATLGFAELHFKGQQLIKLYAAPVARPTPNGGMVFTLGQVEVYGKQ